MIPEKGNITQTSLEAILDHERLSSSSLLTLYKSLQLAEFGLCHFIRGYSCYFPQPLVALANAPSKETFYF